MTKFKLFAFVCFIIAIFVIAMPLTGTAQNSKWWPSAGAVMLGGGHLSDSTAKEFASRFIALAGGPDALIVIIPTADPNMPPQVMKAHTASNPDEIRSYWKYMGARNVVILHTRDRQVANSDTFTKVLRSAKGVFMSGGQSLLLENTYRGTSTNKELIALLDRGGVVAGDSAGAIAIGSAWLTWLPDPFGKRADELGLLPNVAVSPHSSAAKGYKVDDEVMKYLLIHPDISAIDIDEDTMLILNKNTVEVIGTGHVSILDAKKDKTKPVLRLKARAS